MVQSKFYISAYASIKSGELKVNNDIVFKSSEVHFQSFSKEAYKSRLGNYSKFHKMDGLSQLAILASEELLNSALSTSEENNIAIILANNASSLETDRKHQDTITDAENYYPSPSVFVYTLPNICLGEISIKHQLQSENCFLVLPEFNPKALLIQANYLLESQKAEKVLCGWVNLDANNYEAFLYLVSKSGAIAHNEREILNLYQN